MTTESAPNNEFPIRTGLDVLKEDQQVILQQYDHSPEAQKIIKKMGDPNTLFGHIVQDVGSEKIALLVAHRAEYDFLDMSVTPHASSNEETLNAYYKESHRIGDEIASSISSIVEDLEESGFSHNQIDPHKEQYESTLYLEIHRKTKRLGNAIAHGPGSEPESPEQRKDLIDRSINILNRYVKNAALIREAEEQPVDSSLAQEANSKEYEHATAETHAESPHDTDKPTVDTLEGLFDELNLYPDEADKLNVLAGFTAERLTRALGILGFVRREPDYYQGVKPDDTIKRMIDEATNQFNASQTAPPERRSSTVKEALYRLWVRDTKGRVTFDEDACAADMQAVRLSLAYLKGDPNKSPNKASEEAMEPGRIEHLTAIQRFKLLQEIRMGHIHHTTERKALELLKKTVQAVRSAAEARNGKDNES